jgi:hypothetical protein
MQVVEILKVLTGGVKVMHQTQQLRKEIKTLDNVAEVESSEDALVMWGTDYLILVSQPEKGKK